MKESLVHGLSGSLSAVIATLILHPLDTIRIRMQSTHSKTTLRLFLKELRTNGNLMSLYSGFISSLISTASSQGVYFLVYKAMQIILSRGKRQLTILDDLIVSLVASFVNILVNTPIWTVNTRLMKSEKEESISSCFSSIIKHEGFRGLFKGMSTSFILVLNPVIQFVTYEHMKRRFKQKKLHAGFCFLLGALTKFIATMITYPFLTLRTRVQLEDQKSLGFVEVLKDVLDHEGALALYNGLSTKVLQAVLNSAIVLASHEHLVKILCMICLTKKIRATAAK
ncbi:unnamed protein product [Blepharisma stoltei]|uniref:Peroxisomal membrane protein PMP34 n=1 Tax=Blepharisma stoltei TaxID=1481888 RepID=A0AAU9JMS2_9CILI|nr:unnamed protein product [Blepharisma stoltei]